MAKSTTICWANRGAWLDLADVVNLQFSVVRKRMQVVPARPFWDSPLSPSEGVALAWVGFWLQEQLCPMSSLCKTATSVGGDNTY